MQKVKVKKLEAQAFKPFGWVIGAPDGKADIETEFVQYWNDVVDLSNLQADGMVGFLKVKRVPLVTDRLEVLPNSMELYISTGWPAERHRCRSAWRDRGPDLAKLSAFVLENGTSPVIAPGIWHWNPFPLSETANFALVIKRNVVVAETDGAHVDPNEVRIAQFEPIAIEL